MVDRNPISFGKIQIDMELGRRVERVWQSQFTVKELSPVKVVWNDRSQFSVATDFIGACVVQTKCPLSDVDMMGAPVGHLAARVFQEPTELLATFFRVAGLGSWSQP